LGFLISLLSPSSHCSNLMASMLVLCRQSQWQLPFKSLPSLGVVVPATQPWEVEAGVLWILGQPGLHNETLSSKKSQTKTEKRKWKTNQRWTANNVKSLYCTRQC
jgi:hypothetical protein